MNDLDMAALTQFDWAGLLVTIKSSGLEFGAKILVALFIFYVGRLVARILTRALRTVMQKQEVDKILETFVCNLSYWLVMLFVIIAAINHVGVETTSLIAVMGAAGLAVGLALQGSLSNFAAGILIVVFRPYRVGDYVEAGGVTGTIEQVQILTTIMTTPDNKQIIVPNSQIMGGTITNYSANDTRRVDMIVGVSYSDDLDKVRKTIKELMDADERILDEPACLIAVSELADSSVNFVVRPWAKTADYWAVKFDLTEAIKKRFDRENISIPFPQRDVHIQKES
jgi:small conductance mechanosensitive channel